MVAICVAWLIFARWTTLNSNFGAQVALCCWRLSVAYSDLLILTNKRRGSIGGIA